MSGYLKTTSDKYVLIATIILFPIMSHAGGHGIAAIVALAGLLTFFGTSPKNPVGGFQTDPDRLLAGYDLDCLGPDHEFLVAL